MNQVISFDRMVYFGYIFEDSGLLSAKMQASPSSLRSKPTVAFGARAVQETEIKQLRDDLVNNYNVSPIKIRRAGLEEMQKIKQEEMLAKSRNDSASVKGKLQNSRSVKNLEPSYNDIGSRGGLRGSS